MSKELIKEIHEGFKGLYIDSSINDKLHEIKDKRKEAFKFGSITLDELLETIK